MPLPPHPFGPGGPFGAPLPPLLARLHALLEAHAEETEEGVLIVEHDRRPDAASRASPVIVYVPATPQPGAVSGRVAPELIAEVIAPAADAGDEVARRSDDREARYARAGVREFWRVEPDAAGGPPRVHVLTAPDADAGRFGQVVTHAADDQVRSGVLPRLVLRPSDLIA